MTHAHIAAVILAAGQGTRMKSDVPKVLHPIAGKPMVEHVTAALDPFGFGQRIVVVGHRADDVRAALDGRGLAFAHQAEQNGTGHAVQIGLAEVADTVTHVLVLAGDAPLITSATLKRLIDAAADGSSMLATRLDDPTGYGRLVVDGDTAVRIVEHADATDEERAIDLVNVSTYLFDRQRLEGAVSKLDADNAQGELYLTDVVASCYRDDAGLTVVDVDEHEVAGVNDRVQLAAAAAVMRERIAHAHLLAGVDLRDPATTWIDADVSIAPGATILPGTYLHGATSVGAGATVGPNSVLTDTTVAEDAHVRFTVATDATIGAGCDVGPYTNLRTGTVLEAGAKAGGFVEMKKAHIGAGAKVPHLSYVGDATVGADANLGAGTITCNYDGYDKHQTVVGAGAFVGSDVMLVAPVTIGEGAVVGAGSVITADVEPDALAVERNEQIVKPGWAARRRAQRNS